MKLDHSLQAPTQAKYNVITHWLPCGADERAGKRTYDHVSNKISWMYR